jgi:hypothetical protein
MRVDSVAADIRKLSPREEYGGESKKHMVEPKGGFQMAKKDFIKIDVDTFAQMALALRNALEAMESELEEAGYSLDDFEEEEEEENDEECEEEEEESDEEEEESDEEEEEADSEIEEEEEDEGKNKKKPRFPKLS